MPVDLATRQAQALRILNQYSTVIKETVEETPDAALMGVPTGPMYAAFMAQGMSYDTFDLVIAHGVLTGKFTRRGLMLYPIEKKAA